MPRLFFSAFLSVFFFAFSVGARCEAEVRAIPEDTNQVSSWIYAPQDADSPKWWAKDLSKWNPLLSDQVCPGTLAPESNDQRLAFSAPGPSSTSPSGRTFRKSRARSSSG